MKTEYNTILETLHKQITDLQRSILLSPELITSEQNKTKQTYLHGLNAVYVALKRNDPEFIKEYTKEMFNA